jgi:hypothetical protein
MSFGVSDKKIGLTIVAAGTSLPELVTSVVSALKNNADIANGNLIGSTIFNVLLIVPISALIYPIAYNSSFNLDLFVLLGGSVFLFIAMFTGKAKRLDRWKLWCLSLVSLDISCKCFFDKVFLLKALTCSMKGILLQFIILAIKTAYEVYLDIYSFYNLMELPRFSKTRGWKQISF